MSQVVQAFRLVALQTRENHVIAKKGIFTSEEALVGFEPTTSRFHYDSTTELLSQCARKTHKLRDYQIFFHFLICFLIIKIYNQCNLCSWSHFLTLRYKTSIFASYNHFLLLFYYIMENIQHLPENYRKIYEKHWNTIQRSVKNWRFKDVYHFPLLGNENIYNMISDVLQKYTQSIKVNAAFGFILRDRTTDELKFFHSSNSLITLRCLMFQS